MPTPDPDDEMTEFLEPEEVETKEHPEDAAGPRGARRAPRPAADAPAWRARLRRSSFGQLAVISVTAFAIAVAAWWVVRPEDATDTQVSAGAVSQGQGEGAQKAPAVGQTAPGFTATDLKGEPVDLEAVTSSGKPVWLVFAATWCTGCRTEMPDVEAAAAEHPDVDVVVVYVGEGTQTVSSYAERMGLTTAQVADPTQTVSAAYGVMGLPTHYFIGTDRTVAATRVGVLGPDTISSELASINAG